MTVTLSINNTQTDASHPPPPTIRRISPEAQRNPSEAHEDAEYNRQWKGRENTLHKEISKSLFPKYAIHPI
jgi:hypothetical protein